MGAAQRVKNQEEGQAQLDAYRAAGLLDTPENAKLITDWIEQNAKGIFAGASVRSAIEFQRAQLRWKKQEPVAPAPSTPKEPLVNPPDGSIRLPLGTSPARHHTIVQLRDLDQRERAARGREKGTFGSRL